jgi:hypothetical protein
MEVAEDVAAGMLRISGSVYDGVGMPVSRACQTCERTNSGANC